MTMDWCGVDDGSVNENNTVQFLITMVGTDTPDCLFYFTFLFPVRGGGALSMFRMTNT